MTKFSNFLCLRFAIKRLYDENMVDLLLELKEKLGEFLRINKILRALLISDVVLISAFGLVAPIFAIFLTDKIEGGSLVVVGIAGAIHLAVKSLVQIPLGIVIDKTKGEKVDFWMAFGGSLMISAVAFMYLLAREPWHIYVIQFFYGLGSGASYPAWMGLFTRNMEKGRESFIWSLSATPVELGSAVAAGVGGYLAESFGFDLVFGLVGFLALVGTLILTTFYDQVANVSGS